MSANTSIEWTDRTWSVTRGCSVVSPGCHQCYAMKFAHRFSGAGKPFEGLTKPTKAGPQWTGQIRLVEDALLEPLRWKKPQRVFVNSMSDLFHEDVPDAFIDQVFAVMALAHGHTFQVLTKRAARMREYMNGACGRVADAIQALRTDGRPVGPVPHLQPGDQWWPLANVWLGVSVEDQKHADERIPLLLQTPAAVRFISAEPLLGPIDITRWFGGVSSRVSADNPGPTPSAHSKGRPRPTSASAPEVGNVAEPQSRPGQDPRVETRSSNLHWVIVGSESGPGARPMSQDWVRALRDQCCQAEVPFFFKQKTEGHRKVSLPELDGVVWAQFPQTTDRLNAR